MDDLISRNELLKMLNEFISKFGFNQPIAIAQGMVKTMSAANSWISCEERLPEEEDAYLVYGKEQDFFNGGTYSYIGIMQYFPKSKIWNTKAAITVTHWQPLPELPEE